MEDMDKTVPEKFGGDNPLICSRAGEGLVCKDSKECRHSHVHERHWTCNHLTCPSDMQISLCIPAGLVCVIEDTETAL